MTAYTSLDVLKYLAHRVPNTIEWTLDSLGDRAGIYSDEHEELDVIHGMAQEVKTLLGPLAEAWELYSDGRPVITRVEIEHGHTYSHLWHPDPTHSGGPTVITGRRIADPGTDNGGYEIRIIPPGSVELTLTPPRHLQSVPAVGQEGIR